MPYDTGHVSNRQPLTTVQRDLQVAKGPGRLGVRRCGHGKRGNRNTTDS
jgi:hypothetical protein